MEHGLGAHGSMGNSPSFFEFVAAQALEGVVQPALQHMTLVLAQRWPHHLAVVNRNSDEAYLFVNALLQRHYIRKFGASFAESFYGMKRAALSPKGSAAADAIGGSKFDGVWGDAVTDAASRDPPATAPLTDGERRWSFLFLVLMPYIEQKLLKLHDRLTREEREMRLSTDGSDGYVGNNGGNGVGSIRRLAVQAFLRGFPVFRAAWSSLGVGYQILCMFGRLEPFSAGLHISGLRLARLTPADMRGFAAADAAVLALRKEKYAKMGRVMKTFRGFFDAITDAAGFAVPLGVFFLSFMQWWYAREENGQVATLPIPEPPRAGKMAPNGVALPKTQGDCPLCRRSTVNPTALASSGLVFCYPCIFKYVDRYQKCPVTHAAATVDMLVKIHAD